MIGAVTLQNQIPAWLQPRLAGRFLPTSNYPPLENMQTTDRCPGEGCGYHRWLAMAELPLYDTLNGPSPQQVYMLADRETVTAVSGVFITAKPGVIEILEPVTIAGMNAAPGDLIYTLMYLGEGWVRGVFQGKLMDLDPDIIGRQVTRKLDDYEATWWVQIRTSTGVEGWTSQGFSFNGQSGSGGPVPYVSAANPRQDGEMWDYELEVYVPSDAKDISLRIADTTLPLASQEGVQKVQTGPILRSGESYSAELFADDGTRLLAKTFIKPEGGAAPATPLPLASSPSPAAAKPSFDCQYARSATEKLLCSDAQLAAIDVQMVAAHDEILARLPSGPQQTAFQQQHLEWFKEYSRSCNALAGADNAIHDCVLNHLTQRATELRSQVQRLSAPPAAMPAPSNYVAAYGASVTAVKFFESARTLAAPGQRRYTNRFAAAGTRYICFEIDLAYSRRAGPARFPIEVVWYGPDGGVKTRQTLDVRLNEGWSGSNHALGWGSDNGRSFTPGAYRIDFFYGGQMIARGSFVVE